MASKKYYNDFWQTVVYSDSEKSENPFFYCTDLIIRSVASNYISYVFINMPVLEFVMTLLLTLVYVLKRFWEI